MSIRVIGSLADHKALIHVPTRASDLTRMSISTVRFALSIQQAALYATTRLSMSSLLWLAGRVDSILSTCKSDEQARPLWTSYPGSTTETLTWSFPSSEES